VPSGIVADTEGKQECLHVRADAVVTFHDTKPGLKQFGDKVIIADIGIPF
jgi:ADP-dependent NAD(P)H-hydrate dehydratase / NAD(P)H-hydrate epimerase